MMFLVRCRDCDFRSDEPSFRQAVMQADVETLYHPGHGVDILVEGVLFPVACMEPRGQRFPNITVRRGDSNA